MAEFAARPPEYSDPWFAEFETWAQSVEDAIDEGGGGGTVIFLTKEEYEELDPPGGVPGAIYAVSGIAATMPPSGGAGQWLRKASEDDFDSEWATIDVASTGAAGLIQLADESEAEDGTENTKAMTPATTAAAIAALAAPSNPGTYELVVDYTTSPYTLITEDKGQLFTISSPTLFTITLPPESDVWWDSGAWVDVIGLGAGLVTFVGGSGVTVHGTPGVTTRAQYSRVRVVKVGSNLWIVAGDTA